MYNVKAERRVQSGPAFCFNILLWTDLYLRKKYVKNLITVYLPASGICNSAAAALSADRFSSSCFSYSCFTELAFTFIVHVALNGSTKLSNPKKV